MKPTRSTTRQGREKGCGAGSFATAGTFVICLLMSVACSRGGTDRPAKEALEAADLASRVHSLGETQRALELESRTARSDSPYLVVDFPAKRVELKARGRTLRVHALETYQFIVTRPPGNDAWDVTEKKPLRPLQRTRLAPGAGEDAPVDITWGPERMPSEFDLLCEGGRVLEIRASPASSSRIVRGLRAAFARLAEVLLRMSGRSSPAEGGRIRLWLSNRESRVLYWSLPEKLPVIFRAAPGLAADPPAAGQKR